MTWRAFASNPLARTDAEAHREWLRLVNMSAPELQRFMSSDEGKAAGLSREQARAQGIKSGRQSAGWILRMKKTPVSQWSPQMWSWARRQISFIKRMRGSAGPLYDTQGRKTRKHLALLIWGHNPKRR